MTFGLILALSALVEQIAAEPCSCVPEGDAKR